MKRCKLLSLFLILQILMACSPQHIQGENWVIFTESKARQIGIAERFAKPNDPIHYWTPAENDILLIEGGVVSFLQESSNAFVFSEPPLWERLEEYNRQYL